MFRHLFNIFFTLNVLFTVSVQIWTAFCVILEYRATDAMILNIWVIANLAYSFYIKKQLEEWEE